MGLGVILEREEKLDIWGGKEQGEIWGEGEILVGLLVDWCWTSVVGILGSRARKYDFLEIGSRRGYFPSWMGGNSFR
jgi:hypothetical protein